MDKLGEVSNLNFLFEKYLMILLNLTDLKSRYDEEKSLREAADQRLAKLTEQLQKEKQENERLQTELVQQQTHKFLLKCILFSAG